MADDRLALGQAGSHDGVLGTRHACLIQPDAGPAKPAGVHLEPVVEFHAGAQRLQGQKVRVHATPADAVAPGEREFNIACPGKHRAQQGERASDLTKEIRVGAGGTDLPGADRYRVGVVPLDRHPQVLQQGHHGPHIADVG